MSTIDKQRVAAVAALEALGYTFTLSEGWSPPAIVTTNASAIFEADAMHSLLILRADKLAGCADTSEEAAELEMITDAAEAYEAKRWPDGKVDGGKG